MQIPGIQTSVFGAGGGWDLWEKEDIRLLMHIIHIIIRIIQYILQRNSRYKKINYFQFKISQQSLHSHKSVKFPTCCLSF